MSQRGIHFVVIACAVFACKGDRAEEKAVDPASPASVPEPVDDIAPAEMEEMEMARDEAMATGAKMAKDESKRPTGQYAMKADSSPPKLAKQQQLDAARNAGILGLSSKNDADDNSETPARSRSWFPETFLFEPLIVTDDKGAATLDVTVPDRLTSWRVLALAHSRSGSQAGTTTEFLGTLPSYVDPVLPSRLRVGDRIRVPIQLVNTTDKPLRSQLTVSVGGGELRAPARDVSIPAFGTTIAYATITATQAGELRLAATLGGTDSVVRTATVVPVGKRVDVRDSATLAAPRTIDATVVRASPSLADQVRLEVYPGALAIVRSELAASGDRDGIAANAYALLLAGKAPELLTKLGDEPNADAIRSMAILATQRIVRDARVLTMESATLIAQAALAHPQNPILEGIGRRAIAHLETNQLPDGTCGGETGWTLQRLLVATADCARAASGVRGVIARASGAFERHVGHIADPYTAAAILAAGASGDEAFAKKLREMVTAAITRNKTGAAQLAVPAGVVRADGRRPSVLEASALAALALAGDPASKDIVSDLGATVLAGYSSRYGWGDGRANLVATEALIRVFDKPIPESVKISLSKDGEVVATGALNAENVRDILVLEARNVGADAKGTWTVASEPAVPGLGFSLERSSWTSWPAMPRDRGIEIEAPTPDRLSVGNASAWQVTAAAPANTPFEIVLEVPAGVQIDRAILESMQSAGTISSFELSDERLTMKIGALRPGQSFRAELRVIPTLSGAIQSGPVSISMSGRNVTSPPTTWAIK